MQTANDLGYFTFRKRYFRKYGGGLLRGHPLKVFRFGGNDEARHVNGTGRNQILLISFGKIAIGTMLCAREHQSNQRIRVGGMMIIHPGEQIHVGFSILLGSRQCFYKFSQQKLLALSTFALIIGVITVLLMLPIASASDEPAPFVDVLFTAVSAVCVTGLTTVDTASYWSPFGQAVIAAGIVVGGLGVMTLASILGFAVSRHLGLTQRMLATQEPDRCHGQISTLLKAVIATSLTMQALLAIMFLPRFLAMGIDPVARCGTPFSWRFRCSTTLAS